MAFVDVCRVFRLNGAGRRYGVSAVTHGRKLDGLLDCLQEIHNMHNYMQKHNTGND